MPSFQESCCSLLYDLTDHQFIRSIQSDLVECTSADIKSPTRVPPLKCFVTLWGPRPKFPSLIWGTLTLFSAPHVFRSVLCFRGRALCFSDQSEPLKSILGPLRSLIHFGSALWGTWTLYSVTTSHGDLFTHDAIPQMGSYYFDFIAYWSHYCQNLLDLRECTMCTGCRLGGHLWRQLHLARLSRTSEGPRNQLVHCCSKQHRLRQPEWDSWMPYAPS